MTDRVRAMDDAELGRALAGLELAWPETPDFSAGVMVRARSQPARVVRLPLSRTKRLLLIAAAIVLFLAGAAVAARIVIDIGAAVVEVNEGPTTLPSPTTAPFGTPLSVAEAERLLGEQLPLPARLGPPDRVWADEVFTDAGEVVRITVAWEPGPGLPAIEGSRFGAVLMRFEGETDQAFKDVYEDTGVLEPAIVDGRQAVWTTGPHLLRLLTSDGAVDVRVVGNVLLWTDGASTMRLESAVSKSDAVRIATSAGTA